MRFLFKRAAVSLVLLIIVIGLRAQRNAVAIGTTNPNPRAVLMLVGNNQGLVIPSVSDPGAIGATSGDAGMIVYNTTDKKVYAFDGSAWRTVGTSGGTGTTYTLGFSNGQVTLRDDNNTSNVQTAVITIGTKPISLTSPGSGQVLAYDNNTSSWTATTIQGDISVGNVSTGAASYNVTGLKGNPLPSSFSAGALTSDGAGNLSWTPASGSGTVTSVSGSLPITITNGTTTPAISIAQSNATINGYLSSTDWNTFNNKISLAGDLSGTSSVPKVSKIQGVGILSTTPTTNQVLQYNGTNWAPATLTGTTFGNFTTTTSGLAITGGTGAVAGSGTALNIQNATSLQPGLLISADWNTFNNKMNNPFTTNGDLVFGTASAPTRLPAGSNGQVLTISGGLPSWQTASGLVNPMTTAGDIIYGSASGTPTRLATGSGFLKGSATPSYSAVNLANTDVTGTLPLTKGGTGSTTASGALSSIGALGTTLASSQVFVGNGSNIATGVALSGDATISNSGVLTIANNSITDTKVATGAAIAGSKIIPGFGAQNISTTGTLSSGSATVTGLVMTGPYSTLNSVNYTWPGTQGTANTVLINDGTGVLTWATGGSGGMTNPLTTTGDIIYSVGSTPTRLAGSAGFLKSTGALAPTWSAVGLNTSDVTGTLPLTKGGTGSTTAAGALSNIGALGTTLTSSQIFVGNGSNVATGVALSGDAAISNAGVLTIANNAITDTKVATGAAIAGSKIVPSFGAQNISTTGGFAAGSLSQFTINSTGNITKINNVVTSFPTAQGVANSVLTNNGSGTLNWSTVPAPFTTSNFLPKGNGTGLTSSLIQDDGSGVGINGVPGSGNSFSVYNVPTHRAMATDSHVWIGDVDGNSFGNYFFTDFEVSPRFLFLGANVGIGNNSPAFPLDVTGDIVNSGPSNGNLGLTGDLPGYAPGTYPTLKTSGDYMYFSVGGKYSGYLSGADATLGLNNSGGTANVFLSTNGNSYLNGGNVGIGTLFPNAGLEVGTGQVLLATQDGILNIGPSSVGHLTMDQDDLQAKANAGSVSTLYLNYYGGAVDIASPGISTFVRGNLSVSGTLSKGGGSFKIDHPLDPENKYLYHSFVESPDMMNIYNGNIITDAQGMATVALPEYFEALNQDFRYQLTVIGEFAQAIVYKKIANNEFAIKTDKPNIEVSWQVTGIRHDPFAEKNRIKTEVSKEPENVGKYLHPDVYGRSYREGIGHRDRDKANDK